MDKQIIISITYDIKKKRYLICQKKKDYWYFPFKQIRVGETPEICTRLMLFNMFNIKDENIAQIKPTSQITKSKSGTIYNWIFSYIEVNKLISSMATMWLNKSELKENFYNNNKLNSIPAILQEVMFK